MISRTWLLDRCVAAVYSGLAAGIGYPLWVLARPHRAGVDPLLSVQFFWKWAVLAGALFGLLGGLNLAGWFWKRMSTAIWEPRLSPREALFVLALVSFALWFFLWR